MTFCVKFHKPRMRAGVALVYITTMPPTPSSITIYHFITHSELMQKIFSYTPVPPQSVSVCRADRSSADFFAHCCFSVSVISFFLIFAITRGRLNWSALWFTFRCTLCIHWRQNEFEREGHVRRKMLEKNCRAPLLFWLYNVQLFVLMSAFVMGIAFWSVSCLPRGAPCPVVSVPLYAF